MYIGPSIQIQEYNSIKAAICQGQRLALGKTHKLILSYKMSVSHLGVCVRGGGGGGGGGGVLI